MSEYRLSQEITARSVASTWDAAKREWALHGIYFSDEPQTCLCGHFPIIEICTLANRENGAFADVGNCCVKKFLGLPSDSIFQAIKRIREDDTKALNSDAIEHAHRRGWIDDWKRDFYLSTMRKRKLTSKQAEKRKQVNILILRQLSKASKSRS